MADPSPSVDQTVDQAAGNDASDSALAAAFGPDSAPQAPGAGSVLEALSASVPGVPHVQLRQPLGEPVTPVNLPGSSEIPAAARERGGSLQLLGEIARGGMGAVLKGRDVDLGRDLAVKVLLEAHQGKPELARRFIEEAQITGQLQHPGVAPVYELGVFGDQRPYFTMKLVKGKTLAALLAERKRGDAADLPRLLGIFAHVCQTLGYAHARGVIHRDLKPSNIMVGAFGEVQVMDWGLAKVLQEGGIADDEKAARAREQPEVVIRTGRTLGSSTPETGSGTVVGSVLGTPAYMAPEQARGDVDLVDERADVFGLGGILCEILTGKPPFSGKAAEAQRRAQAGQIEDACLRLDGCRADAELIALAKRCLAAEPGDRPRHAGEVAEAVTAYERSVTERLRRAELERAAAEARAVEEARTRQLAEARATEVRKRQRLTLALAATVFALFVLGSAGVAWRWQERTAREQERVAREQEQLAQEHDVDAALTEARAHQAAGRWPEARAALEKATGRLGGAGPLPQQERLGQMLRDLKMVAEVDDIRLSAAEAARGTSFDHEARTARYLMAFRAYDLDVTTLDRAEAVARLRRAAIREELLAALDDWLLHAPHDVHVRLQAVADGADDSAWRRAFRAAALARNGKKLRELARQEEALGQPPGVLNWLAVGLRGAGQVEQAVALLRQAQRRYPGDFWLNFELGYELAVALQPPRPEEAVGYFRAAVALRPASAAAHNELGAALEEKGDREGAIAEYRKSIELDPKWGAAYTNLGNALDLSGDFPGAVAEYRKALALEPKCARTHYNLAVAFADHGKLDDAVAEFREALGINPNYTTAHYGLGLALQGKRDLPGAAAEYHRAITLNPNFAEAHCNLGLVLRDQGALAASLASYRRGHELGSRQPRWRYPSAEWVREAERLLALDTTLAKFVKGDVRPTAAERIALADFCQKPFKRRFATAVRLYSEAFADDPKLADGPRLPHRYNAACAAAQAGCGQGNDAPVKEEERRRLRGQALEWLRADLAAWTKLATDQPRESAAAVRQTLQHWQTDPDLAGLRDARELAKLPAEERETCGLLWAEVEALVKGARDK
jgi:serine/threonine-protein kinase